MEGVLAVIWMFAGNFAPRNWAFCDGQILSISQNTALFSLLGTIYGGDGRTTFALPDMRSRLPMHAGQGPGLTTRTIGQRSGQEIAYLTTNEMPAHSHATAVAVSTEVGVESTSSSQFLASRAGGFNQASTAGQFLGGVALANQGGSQAHNNLQPCQVVNFVICLYGIFPSRN